MKKKVAVIGAGGFGREVIKYIEDINEVNTTSKTFEIVGFVDDNYEKDFFVDGYPVLGKIEELNDKDDIYVVCAIGNPKVKKELIERAKNNNCRFFNVIHPSVYMTKNVELGEGIIIGPYTVITTNIVIGNHVSINPRCGFGHDAIIKDYASLYWDVNISGNVVIEEGSELGSGSTIIQGKKVGPWSRIGAGAVVVDDVAEGATMVGVPAKDISQ
ncbi:acetyltransferase [Natranaerofaba carboxydovora]|uniref:acetyltransferase n=1 Tax=Natranaerofaba carboxydovora TaxID=2742683 RepID=UPI001F13CFFE|nr:acetyltransferase [Natranaerofaba carboxydovora]UMZ74712.1 Putative acetyltransferase EpsM [Natranaerofaba carboxydovora]